MYEEWVLLIPFLYTSHLFLWILITFQVCNYHRRWWKTWNWIRQRNERHKMNVLSLQENETQKEKERCCNSFPFVSWTKCIHVEIILMFAYFSFFALFALFPKDRSHSYCNIDYDQTFVSTLEVSEVLSAWHEKQMTEGSGHSERAEQVEPCRSFQMTRCLLC